jgi:hypothetical protein
MCYKLQGAHYLPCQKQVVRFQEGVVRLRHVEPPAFGTVVISLTKAGDLCTKVTLYILSASQWPSFDKRAHIDTWREETSRGPAGTSACTASQSSCRWRRNCAAAGKWFAAHPRLQHRQKRTLQEGSNKGHVELMTFGVNRYS